MAAAIGVSATTVAGVKWRWRRGIGNRNRHRKRKQWRRRIGAAWRLRPGWRGRLKGAIASAFKAMAALSSAA
jgi:hypothetical protein